MEKFLDSYGQNEAKEIGINQFTIQITKIRGSLALQSRIFSKVYRNMSLSKRFYDISKDRYRTFPWGCREENPDRTEAQNAVRFMEKLDAEISDKTLALSSKKNWPKNAHF